MVNEALFIVELDPFQVIPKVKNLVPSSNSTPPVVTPLDVGPLVRTKAYRSSDPLVKLAGHAALRTLREYADAVGAAIATKLVPVLTAALP